jgi:RNA polymerase sigma-70 factor (ECF subfamily)
MEIERIFALCAQLVVENNGDQAAWRAIFESYGRELVDWLRAQKPNLSQVAANQMVIEWLEQTRRNVRTKISTEIARKPFSDVGKWIETVDFWQYVRLARVLLSAGRKDDAEDIVQATLVKMLTRSSEILQPKAYFQRCLSRRIAKPQRPVSELSESSVTVISDPLDSIIQTESIEVVRRAVQNLNDEGREAIKLYYFDDLKYEEVAQQLQVPLGTVKSRLHRAIKNLREYILKRRSDDECS